MVLAMAESMVVDSDGGLDLLEVWTWDAAVTVTAK
jgi:hypothetical protein